MFIYKMKSYLHNFVLPLDKTSYLSICIVLLTKNHITHMDYQESFRQVRMENTWPDDARFVYLYNENQADFVSALGTDDKLPEHRLPVSIPYVYF